VRIPLPAGYSVQRANHFLSGICNACR
jgi:hypothetical protein